MNLEEIKVSIHCLTYNQEPYIRQCLDGFVMQKTNFRFEAIVHDDASTDGTTEIIKEYQERYPNIIKPIFQQENQYSKGIPGFITDLVNHHCHGKYIAICEGDDYWTEPNKLQKQYDFMEAHPECSMCFHPDIKLYPSGKQVIRIPKIKKQFYNVDDMILSGGGHIGTRTIFFPRKYYLDTKAKPEFWKNSKVGDLPLKLFLSSKGSIGYIDDVMAVYRYKSSDNAWSARNRSIPVWLKNVKSNVLMYEAFDKYTNFKYHNSIRKMIWRLKYIIRFRGILGAIKYSLIKK